MKLNEMNTEMMYGNAMPVLSIIMPVYKVEAYLREAVNSVLGQTFTDWELILVDDGSPDGCPAICDEFAAKDVRVKVLHLRNGGQARARNEALKIVRGKYVGFVDSDDWIDARMYELLVGEAEATGADMALGSYVQEYVGFTRARHATPAAGCHGGPELMSEGYRDKLVQSISCDKIFRREVISGGYVPQRFFEDHVTMLRWFSGIDRWVVVPDALYHYRMRRSGVINGFSAEKRMAKFNADVERHKFVLSLSGERLGMDRAEIDSVLVESAVGTAKALARNMSDRDAVCRYIKEIVAHTSDAFANAGHVLPSKVAQRFSDMCGSPRRFILKMRVGSLFAFASRRREDNLFD